MDWQFLVAVEIVSFNRKGLIDDAAAVEALDKVLGTGNGQPLLTGTENDRIAALQRFLPRDAPKSGFGATFRGLFSLETTWLE